MRRVAAAVALLAATPAIAQERDYCPERPGLTTPACIVDKGHVSVETALADWTVDEQDRDRTDTVLVGDTLVRIGVTDSIEARIGWTPFAHVRERDPSGVVRSKDRVGDVSLGAKVSLHNPDGSGVSVAVLPTLTLPVGRAPVGAGDWAAEMLLPVTWQLSDAVSLAATPEVDAAVDEDRSGRHLAVSLAGGVAVKFAKSLTLTGEAQLLRDDDPAGRTTQAVAALSLAWLVRENLQFDLFGAAGLNRDSPDLQLYSGVSARF